MKYLLAGHLAIIVGVTGCVNMQNQINMIHDSLEYRKLVNEFYYFGHQWKDRLEKLTSYTHGKTLYKLIGVGNHILESITTQVATDEFKIVNIIVYVINSLTPGKLNLTSDYSDNITIMEAFVVDSENRKDISKYAFKIMENEKIFTVLDSEYNIIRQNGIIHSMDKEGYAKSGICINILLSNFITSDGLNSFNGLNI